LGLNLHTYYTTQYFYLPKFNTGHTNFFGLGVSLFFSLFPFSFLWDYFPSFLCDFIDDSISGANQPLHATVHLILCLWVYLVPKKI